MGFQIKSTIYPPNKKNMCEKPIINNVLKDKTGTCARKRQLHCNVIMPFAAGQDSSLSLTLIVLSLQSWLSTKIAVQCSLSITSWPSNHKLLLIVGALLDVR